MDCFTAAQVIYHFALWWPPSQAKLNRAMASWGNALICLLLMLMVGKVLAGDFPGYGCCPGLGVHIGRFDNLPFFHFGPNFLVIIKIIHVFGKSMGIDCLSKVSKKSIVQHPAHFRPFLKFPAEKLIPHLHISFKTG